MKLLCISDVIDSLVYSSSIKERFGNIDFVLSAGDLPLDYLEFIVSSLDRPLFFVFGNHNLGDFYLYKKKFIPALELNVAGYFTQECSAGAVHIGSRAMYEAGVLFAGLGGSMIYNRGENQFSELGMKLEVLKLIPHLLFNKIRYGRYLDILLTHAAPHGIHDKDDQCHKGFKIFLWFMRVFKPKYLIHGHIHLDDRQSVRKTRYGGTIVVNAYGYHVIDTKLDESSSEYEG